MNSTEADLAQTAVDRRLPRILVVDDERSMRELLSIVLRREGYDVVVAENGRAASAVSNRRLALLPPPQDGKYTASCSRSILAPIAAHTRCGGRRGQAGLPVKMAALALLLDGHSG